MPPSGNGSTANKHAAYLHGPASLSSPEPVTPHANRLRPTAHKIGHGARHTKSVTVTVTVTADPTGQQRNPAGVEMLSHSLIFPRAFPSRPRSRPPSRRTEIAHGHPNEVKDQVNSRIQRILRSYPSPMQEQGGNLSATAPSTPDRSSHISS